MAKIKLTRPELKKQRDALARYNRYLPMLKLKQQLLQSAVLQAEREHRQARAVVKATTEEIDVYRPVLSDAAGLDLRGLSQPSEIITEQTNIAGVNLPTFRDVRFPLPRYSLFATPPWVDKALSDLRRLSRLEVQADILGEQERRLRSELLRITQRVNLFEKIMIPSAREAIRVIRIRLGDEQTAAVGRAKIAKNKIEEYGDYSEVAAGSPAGGAA